MNFLNKPGIQSALDNIIIEDRIHDNHIDKKVNFDSPKKNKFYYIVISSAVLFITFCLYVFSSNSTSSLSLDSIIISDTIDQLNNKKNMIIESVENSKNKINITLSCKSEGALFENAYELKDKYPNVKMKTNSNLHQIWIQQDFITKPVSDIGRILYIINNDNILNVEKEIINENLIIIGTIKDIKYLFLLLEKNDLEKIEFYLNLIDHEFNNTFYKLII
jgi:hypothetical protein